MYISGTLATVLISLFTVLLGTLIGILIAFMKLSKFKIFRWISSTYVEITRGTPVLVQVLIWYTSLSPVFKGLSDIYIGELEIKRILPGAIALSLNSGAYVSEIIRAGILAVDKGQTEAAESLGMKKPMFMKYIIMPQAIKNILPALGNEFVVLIKESSILFAIGIQELMAKTQAVQGSTLLGIQPLLVTAVIYFIITFILSRVLAKYERRLNTDDRN
ncbi:MAG: amino acid ABC transporter permease [Eubacteriales bacterium]|nr:amino acid ABC transporter permease [Eubacteriales bacterium]